MDPSHITTHSPINNITYNNGVYSYHVNDTATSTHGIGIGNIGFTFISGHKYYFSSKFSSVPSNLVYFYFRGVGSGIEVFLGKDANIEGVFDNTVGTVTPAITMLGMVLSGSLIGDMQQSNYHIIDLTKMFGSDAGIVSGLGLTSVSDITANNGEKTIAALHKIFPAEYYAHHTSASGDLTLFNFSNPQTFRTFALSNKCKIFLKI